MKIFGLLLVLAASCSAKNVATRAQVQVGSGPMILDNSGSISDSVTQVNVLCRNNEADLTLVRNSGSTRSGQIELGTPGSIGATCASVQKPIPEPAEDGATLATFFTALPACANTGSIVGAVTEFRWAVRVTEFIPGVGDTEYPVVSDFTVLCKSDAQDPSAVDNLPLPGVVNEGLAQFDQNIPFNLVQDTTNPSSRVWVLTLNPTNLADLRGLSYQIQDLTATVPRPLLENGDADTQPAFTAVLIDDGCIQDAAGVRAVKNTEANTEATTITVARFRFTGNPTAAVSFAATVTLCTPTTGGVCAPVKDCTRVTDTDKKQAPRAAGEKNGLVAQSGRSRRSLTSFSVGLLSAQLV